METPVAPVAETLTPTPVEAPVAAAESGPQKPLSQDERFAKAVKELELQKKEGVTTPEAQPGTKEGEQPKPEEATEKTSEETTEVPEFVDKVTFNGKEAPIDEILSDAKFEVFAKGEMREIEGLPKLLDMASMGYDSIENNKTAREAVTKAQDVIREIEAATAEEVQKKVQEGVATTLDNLMASINQGVNPATGSAFTSQQQKVGAVELVNKLKTASSQTTPTEKPLTREEVSRMVDELSEKKLKTEISKRDEQRAVEAVINTATETLQKATDPLMQNFLLDDGKTLNTRLFKAFKADVQAEADQLWVESGKPMTTQKISEFVAKAAQSVLKEYKPSLRKIETEKKAPAQTAPVVKPQSGTPLTTGKTPKFKNQDQAWDYRFKAAMAKPPGR